MADPIKPVINLGKLGFKALSGLLKGGKKATKKATSVPKIPGVDETTNWFKRNNVLRNILGLGALGAGGFLGWQLATGSTPEEEYANILDTLNKYQRDSGVSTADRLAAFDRFVEEDRARRAANMPELPDMVAAVDQRAAAAQNALADYLATGGAYATNQGRAVSDAYSRMAANLQQSAEDEFTRGQMTAADLEALYSNLAAQQAATAAGAGQATPASETAGLAAPSGAAATAPQTTRTYGRGLADYLGREAGIESAAIGRTAQSQALQGAAMAQSLQDYFAMQANQAEFKLANELAAARSDAAAQQAYMEYQRDMDELDRESAIAEQRLALEMGGEDAGDSDYAMRMEAANTAFGLWERADEEQKAVFTQRTGATTLDEFVDVAFENPYIIPILMGG